MPPHLKTRKGAISLEALLVLPVLLLVGVGLIQLCLLASADQRLEAAATAGVRVAAKGGDVTTVTTAVQTVLGTGVYTNAVISVEINDDMGVPIPNGGLVRVAVAIPAQSVIPFGKAFAGAGLVGRDVIATAVAVRE